MHQLRVLRCDVCQAPFLFESSLEDHKKRDHELVKDNRISHVEKVVDTTSKGKEKRRRRSRTKAKQKRSA